MVGALSGMMFNIVLGSVLDSADNTGFFWAFLVTGSSYLILLGVVHLIMPKMQPLDENLNPIQ